MRLPLAEGSAPLRDALEATRTHFVAAAVFSALQNLLLLAPTLYMLQIYDRAVPTQGKLTLFFLTLVVLFALGVLALLDMVRSRILVRAGVRLDRLLAPRLLDATFANAGRGGDPLSRVALREFDTLRQALTGPAAIALLDAPWTPIYAIVAFMIHPALGLLAVIGGAVLLFLTWRSERSTRPTLLAAGRAASLAYMNHDNTTSAASVVRALGMRRSLVERQLRERETLLQLQTDATQGGGGYMSTTKFVRMALQSLALGLGALLAIDNQISGGAIFAASFLVARSMGPIEHLVGAWKSVVQARSAWSTLAELFARAPDSAPRTQLPAPTGKIDIEHLTVLNPARDAALIRDVSFSVEPGEVVAIVGPSGAGKSTLLRAIAGAIAADRGTVRFDGAEASAWDPDDLGVHLGFMPQEPSLLAGTAKENIARFRSGPEEAADVVDVRVVKAAQACGVHDMILRLPSGYETSVGWGGQGLSAGQAQQLALARALFGRPNILLLDEPNAHLDAEGEQRLTATLQQEKARGASVLVVVHRTSILSAVDKLLVMRDGAVEMFGPRDEVLRRIGPPALAPQSARS